MSTAEHILAGSPADVVLNALPHPVIVVRTIRAFAWTALAVGFCIVVWIIYAMLFAYR